MTAREGQAIGVIERLGEADAFLAVGDPFLELSLVGENPSQIARGPSRQEIRRGQTVPG